MVMNRLLFILYTIVIRVGNIYIFIGSMFSHKLRLLKEGREETRKKLKSLREDVKRKGKITSNKIKHGDLIAEGGTALKSKYRTTVWMHCASLGEFEQGRPLIEKIKLNYPDSYLALSFFSPSGYEIQKNYDKAELIFYLPSDTPENCDSILQTIQPDIVIFVKYEFWWNLINKIVAKNIRIFLIAAVFRKNDYFFKSFFRPFLVLLRNYNMIFVQDKTSADILHKHNVTNQMITGDTRIDRVIQRSKASDVPLSIKEYAEDKTVIVYGSIWESDLNIVIHCIKRFPGFVHIMAPHDISTANVKKLKSLIPTEVCLYSDDKWSGNLLVINNIGMLGSLYSLAKYVYIGGGFQKGIHNILEPAVFRIPVFFGPNHTKFNEATILQQEKVAFSVNNASKIIEIIDRFEQSEAEYVALSKKTSDFFIRSQGATEKTHSFISRYL